MKIINQAKLDISVVGICRSHIENFKIFQCVCVYELPEPPSCWLSIKFLLWELFVPLVLKLNWIQAKFENQCCRSHNRPSLRLVAGYLPHVTPQVFLLPRLSYISLPRLRKLFMWLSAVETFPLGVSCLLISPTSHSKTSCQYIISRWPTCLYVQEKNIHRAPDASCVQT